MLLTEQHEFGWLETFDVSQVQVNEAEDDEYEHQEEVDNAHIHQAAH